MAAEITETNAKAAHTIAEATVISRRPSVLGGSGR
jgi:hypothetical protein